MTLTLKLERHGLTLSLEAHIPDVIETTGEEVPSSGPPSIPPPAAGVTRLRRPFRVVPEAA